MSAQYDSKCVYLYVFWNLSLKNRCKIYRMIVRVVCFVFFFQPRNIRNINTGRFVSGAFARCRRPDPKTLYKRLNVISAVGCMMYLPRLYTSPTEWVVNRIGTIAENNKSRAVCFYRRNDKWFTV